VGLAEGMDGLVNEERFSDCWRVLAVEAARIPLGPSAVFVVGVGSQLSFAVVFEVGAFLLALIGQGRTGFRLSECRVFAAR
jgi:hypothetical protein